MERRLIAILAADVVDYSRLMADDETGTLKILKDCEARIIEPSVADHNGRIFKRMGDGYLVEFSSLVDCVECAVAWQKAIGEANSPLIFRIGINLGDVLTESDDIYGNGVNIATRIESLAQPGGISMTAAAFHHVKGKLPYTFQDTGEHMVKNIAEPIRVYELRPEWQASAGLVRSIPKEKGRRTMGLFFLALVSIIIAAGSLYFKTAQQEHPAPLNTELDSPSSRASKGASIAVLPFASLSNDKEQEYFSDGITNDIITDLSRFRELLVISSNTVFTYKGRTADAQTLGQELQVKYLLEGSVQRIADKVRINARLINSAEGTPIWAERYDREYADIFQLQIDIVKSIVAALAISVSQAEQERALRKHPQDLDAYDYLLRGSAYYVKRTREANRQAQEMFEQAATIDPLYGEAYAWLGMTEYSKVSYGWTEFPLQALERAFSYGQKALELDSDISMAHTLMCNVYTFRNEYELAILSAEQALKLNPNDANAYSQMGWSLLWAGRIDEAIAALEMSLQLDNTSVRNVWLHLGMAYYLQKRYGEAVEILEKGLVKRPNFVGYHLMLAATYAQLGRVQKANQSADRVHHLDPFFTIEGFGSAFRNPDHRLAIAEGLRKAGLQ